jgi:hypothetical protein
MCQLYVFVQEAEEDRETIIVLTVSFFNLVQLLQLLLKASQDKRFVCEEAEKALVSMTTWISPKELLLKLQVNLEHRNPRIRAKASSCVCRSVSKLVNVSFHFFFFHFDMENHWQLWFLAFSYWHHAFENDHKLTPFSFELLEI